MQAKHVWAVLAAALAAGCSGLVTDAVPEEARLVLTGTTPVDIRVITSTRFALFRDPDTGEVSSVLQQADTTDLRPPFDERYDISQFGEFLVKVVNADTTSAQFDMRISIDGDTKFDQTLNMRAADGNAASYEWRWIY